VTYDCRNCGKPGIEPVRHDWKSVCHHCGQLVWLRPGDVAECTVSRLTPYGVIVELPDGVQGLIHVTELTDKSIRHPDDVVRVGSVVHATVLRIDVSERRIGLTRRQGATS
jgi:ribosomal protein S1